MEMSRFNFTQKARIAGSQCKLCLGIAHKRLFLMGAENVFSSFMCLCTCVCMFVCGCKMTN